MRRHINFGLLVLITLLRSAFLGSTKFFLWSFLEPYHISLEEIAGYISLGVFLSYVIGGAIAHSIRKKRLIITAGLAIVGLLAVGYFTGYQPLSVFVGITVLMGVAYGFWIIVKSAFLSREILKSGRRETIINGILNAALLIGLLLGSYYGFDIYRLGGEAGFIIIALILIVANIFTMFTNYDIHFRRKALKESFAVSIPNLKYISKKYVYLLIPAGVFWAVSTVIAQKMFEISVGQFDKDPQTAILVIVYSIIGIIIGHALSTLFIKTKKVVSVICLIILGLIFMFFPSILKIYDSFLFLNIMSFGLGILFGIVVNIIEGRYFWHVGADHQKEYGAAAYGLVTNIIIFVVMISSDNITQHINLDTSFAFIGIITLASIFFFKKFDPPK